MRSKLLIYIFIALILSVVMVFITIRRTNVHYDPYGFTIANLNHINLVMNILYSEKGEWPDQQSWVKQIAPYIGRDAEEASRDVISDAWGNLIGYIVNDITSKIPRFVYSFGSNQIDERGSGDDIVVAVDELIESAPTENIMW